MIESIVVNGISIPVSDSIKVVLKLSGDTRCPDLNLDVEGGRLDVHKSNVHHTGDVSLHIFG